MAMESVKQEAATLLTEVIGLSKIQKGDLLVIGCSSSEVLGKRIGTGSSVEAAEAIFEGFAPILKEHGIALAAQCCEHLNRALVVERTTMERFGLTQVNVIPQPKAGGSFATTVYKAFDDPIVVESTEQKAVAGIDIGGVMIGMHIMPVVVPLKITQRRIGEAVITAARRRPKYVGGIRAVYDESLE